MNNQRRLEKELKMRGKSNIKREIGRNDKEVFKKWNVGKPNPSRAQYK